MRAEAGGDREYLFLALGALLQFVIVFTAVRFCIWTKHAGAICKQRWRLIGGEVLRRDISPAEN
jgi:ABC-type uncharacterized transport system permease subunit